jgi:SAM-dependent methyltransferase
MRRKTRASWLTGPFTSVRFPIASPDLATHFSDVANAGQARFQCYVDLAAVPAERYLRFEFLQGGHRAGRRTAWWYPPAIRDRGSERGAGRARNRRQRQLPLRTRRRRLFNRIQDYLDARFGRRYETSAPSLTGGAARADSCPVRGASSARRSGAPTSIPTTWTIAGALPFAQCRVFPAAAHRGARRAFDLIIGISVCTHLSEANQERWLTELRRISRPGGLVLLSVQGLSPTALYREAADLIRKLKRSGFVVKGVNPSINDLIGERSYYLDVIQTRDHIREH